MRCAVVMGMLLCPATSAGAEDQAAEPLAKIFVSLCVRAVPDLERIETTAAAMSLREIAALEGTAEVPAAPGTRRKSWRVSGGTDGPASLNISQGKEGGKTVTVCALVSPSAPAEPVERAMQDLLHLGRRFRTDTDASGQSSTYWDMTFDGQKMIVSTTDLRPGNPNGVNLAATVVTRP